MWKATEIYTSTPEPTDRTATNEPCSNEPGPDEPGSNEPETGFARTNVLLCLQCFPSFATIVIITTTEWRSCI